MCTHRRSTTVPLLSTSQGLAQGTLKPLELGASPACLGKESSVRDLSGPSELPGLQSDPTLAQPGWGFLLPLGCGTSCWAGSIDGAVRGPSPGSPHVQLQCERVLGWRSSSCLPPPLQIPFGIWIQPGSSCSSLPRS